MSLPKKEADEYGAGRGMRRYRVGIETVGFREGGLCDQHSLWDRVVVQTRNVPERKGQVGGGLAVWRIEGAVLGDASIAFDFDMEGVFDARDIASDDNIHAIAAAADDREFMFPGEFEDGLIVFLAGAEAVGKLLTVTDCR